MQQKIIFILLLTTVLSIANEEEPNSNPANPVKGTNSITKALAIPRRWCAIAGGNDNDDPKKGYAVARAEPRRWVAVNDDNNQETEKKDVQFSF